MWQHSTWGNNPSLLRLPRLYSAMLNYKGIQLFYAGVTKISKEKEVVTSGISDLKFGWR